MKPFFNFYLYPGTTNTAFENSMRIIDLIIRENCIPAIVDNVFIFDEPPPNNKLWRRYLDNGLELDQYRETPKDNGIYSSIIE